MNFGLGIDDGNNYWNDQLNGFPVWYSELSDSIFLRKEKK
jgi:hypothetical protein